MFNFKEPCGRTVRTSANTSIAIILVSLGLAVLATIVAESRLARLWGDRIAWRFAGFAILCCYGVCVGVLSAVIGYFFPVPEWLAVVIAVPLGLPILVLVAKISEG